MNSTLNLIDKLHDKNMDHIFDLIKDISLDDPRYWNCGDVEKDISYADKKKIFNKFMPKIEKIDPQSLSLAHKDIQEAIRWIVKIIVDFLLGPDPDDASMNVRAEDPVLRNTHEYLMTKLQAILDSEKTSSAVKP